MADRQIDPTYTFDIKKIRYGGLALIEQWHAPDECYASMSVSWHPQSDGLPAKCGTQHLIDKSGKDKGFLQKMDNLDSLPTLRETYNLLQTLEVTELLGDPRLPKKTDYRSPMWSCTTWFDYNQWHYLLYSPDGETVKFEVKVSKGPGWGFGHVLHEHVVEDIPQTRQQAREIMYGLLDLNISDTIKLELNQPPLCANSQ